MLNITITGDKEVIARFDTMSDRVHDALFGTITELSRQMEASVKVDKLSGQVLNKVTGRLQGSITSDVNDSGNRIIGRVFSRAPMPYAAIHEFGGQFKTRLGTGKGPPKKDGKAFGTMPERSFLRSTLSDYRERIIEGMTDAVNKAVKA